MFENYHPGPGPSNQAVPSGPSFAPEKLRDNTDYTYKCRVCLNQGKLPIFGPAPNFADALSLIAAIHVSEDKQFPRFLCLKCHSQLQGAIKLRKTAQHTDLILKKITSDAFFTDDKSQYFEDDLTAELEQNITENDVSIKSEVKYHGDKLFHTSKFCDFFDKPEQITINVDVSNSFKFKVEVDATSNGDFRDDVIDEPEQSIMKNDVSKESKAKLKSEDVPTVNTTSATDPNKDDRFKLIQCDISMKKYLKSDSKKHMAHHSIVKCRICKTSIERKKYQRHVQQTHKHSKQTKSKYICETCGKELRSEKTYESHKSTHSNEFPFKCELCPYRGRHKGLLSSHMGCHNKEYKYQCSKCPSRFQRPNYLRIHLRTHEDKKYKCDTCTQAYYTLPQLKKHQEVDHLGIRDVLCNICGKDFGTRKSMMRHQQKVHKRKSIPKGQNATYLEAERRNDQEDIVN